MTQYIRYCSVTADGAGGTLDVSTLRCRFEIEQRPLITPSILTLRITNLAPAHARAIINKEFSRITIDAGYQDGHGIIFKGNILQGIYGRENPTDTLVTITAADGDHAHNYATVNTTLPPGSTPQQHLNVAMQAMQKYGVSLGYVGVDLSKPVYPRAVTLFGMARDVITRIAELKNATAYYRDEKVRMVPKNGSLPGGPIVLNSNTGLIGMPTQTTNGIYARCLIDPAITQNSQVYIDQKDVQGGIAAINQVSDNTLGLSQLAAIATDGLYTVWRIDTFGDTRGQEWYMDLKMLATNAPQPPKTEAIKFGAAPSLGAS